VSFVVQQLGTPSTPPGGSFNLTNVLSQNVPASGWNGYGWTLTNSVTIPLTWATGLYALTAKGPGDSSFTEVFRFVVRPPNPGSTSKILLLVDFITPQAYNNAGGKSLYDFNSNGPRASTVSFNRPYNSNMGSEPDIINWFASRGYRAEVASTTDLHTNANLLSPYSCVVLGSHNEYWSQEMRDQVESFVRHGGNVVCLSGNTCFRQVRMNLANARTLTCFKDSQTDPESDIDLVTVAWAQTTVNRPPNAMLGAGWTHGAFAGPGDSPGAYAIAFPTHWTMAGVTIPVINAFMGYETDAVPFVWESEGYPRVTGEEETPLSTTVLASADLGSWTGKPGSATATLFVRNGMVFHAGTTEWAHQMTIDPVLDQITRNVMARFHVPRPFDWELVGTANGVTAAAAADNRLFATTSDNILWRRYPVLADVVWRSVGSAVNVRSMAGTKGLLFAVTSDNNLWCRPPVETNIGWTWIGTGPAAGTLAIAGLGSTLYAVDRNGYLGSRPANTSNIAWRAVTPSLGTTPVNASIIAMTSYAGVLIAATSGNRLLRTNSDFVEEANTWVDVINCNNATGLAVVDNMLFVATSDNQLWWLDLYASGWDPQATLA
jgi:hypothetical protein